MSVISYIYNARRTAGLWLAAVLCLAAASCRGDDSEAPDVPQDDDETEGVYVRCTLNLRDSGRPGSRATEFTTPGTSRENAIEAVELLVYDNVTDQLIDIASVGKSVIEAGKKSDTQYEFATRLYVPQGKTIRISAAINFTPKMHRLYFINMEGNNVSVSSAYNDYVSVINEFIPGSSGSQQTLEAGDGTCIPMTGVFTAVDGSGDVFLINAEHKTLETALPLTADVSRIMAKMHLVTTMADGSDIYVKSESEDMSRCGWINVRDVYYLPNGVNKSSYLFPQYDAGAVAAVPVDLNMSLEEYMDEKGFNKALWSNAFMFSENSDVYALGAGVDATMQHAEAYTDARWDATFGGTGTGNRYTRGMYCTENYFNMPADEVLMARLENIADPIPMVTHMTVAARMTPHTIIVQPDFRTKMNAFVSNYNSAADKAAFLDGMDIAPDAFGPADIQAWEASGTGIKEHYFKDGVIHTQFYNCEQITPDSEQEAAYIIKWSLMFNGHWSGSEDYSNGKYPAGTFFVYDRKYEAGYDGTGDRYVSLTDGAVEAVHDVDVSVSARSVPHIGGWGYYYTYLDNTEGTVDGVTPFTASQVTRNTYYLVNVTNFGFPGGTVTSPEFIKANTIPTGWDYGGRGDIVLN